MLNLGSSQRSGDKPTVDLAMLSSSGVEAVATAFSPLCFCSTPVPFQTQTRKKFKTKVSNNKTRFVRFLGSDSLEQSFHNHQFAHCICILHSIYVLYIY